MVSAFIENPILLLFVVAALGYWVGNIRFRGSSLGVAAVLFVGLVFGSLSPDLRIPDVVTFLGLTIFVYTVGLSSGPSFFALFRQRGSRDLIFVFAMLTFSVGITVLLHFLFVFEPSTTAGLFAGSTTNTPALAGLLDQIGNLSLEGSAKKAMSEMAVIGYSLSYPMGVLAPMLAIILMQRWFRIDYKAEEKALRNDYPVRQDIAGYSVEITKPEITNIYLRDLKQEYGWSVLFGRTERNDKVTLTHWDTKFKLGDRVSILGDREEVEGVAAQLGVILPSRLSDNQSEYMARRFFVSNPKVVGQKLTTLNLTERFSAMITRVTRGDIDLLANSETVLELGDRVRVVSRRRDAKGIASLLGDSYDQLSKIDLFSFGLGLALGLLLGMVTFTLPGGLSFRLGFAGGPIIVGLVLGGLRRTGPINWSLPYSANLILRQVGLILLLTGIGVNSGHQFVATVSEGQGGPVFLASAIISFVTSFVTLLVGYKWLKIPFSFLTGMVANQPAILDFALSKSGNKLPNLGFTIMMPVSIISKVVYAQLLFALLN